MTQKTEHLLRRASEAKDAARMSPDPKLSNLFLEIAESYEALAENEEWLAGRRSPLPGASALPPASEVDRTSIARAAR